MSSAAKAKNDITEEATNLRVTDSRTMSLIMWTSWIGCPGLTL